MTDTVEFDAVLAPIQSAIRVSGDGDTLRLQLDIPLHQSPEAVKVMLFSGKVMHVTIKELEATNAGPKRTKAHRY